MLGSDTKKIFYGLLNFKSLWKKNAFWYPFSNFWEPQKCDFGTRFWTKRTFRPLKCFLFKLWYWLFLEFIKLFLRILLSIYNVGIRHEKKFLWALKFQNFMKKTHFGTHFRTKCTFRPLKCFLFKLWYWFFFGIHFQIFWEPQKYDFGNRFRTMRTFRPLWKLFSRRIPTL